MASGSRATPHKTMCRLRHWIAAGAIVGIVVAAASWAMYRFWPRQLPCRFASGIPRLAVVDGQMRLQSPTGLLTAAVGSYTDELSAYLNFQYLRSLQDVEGDCVLLTATEAYSGPVYRLHFLLDNDLLTGIPYLASLQAHGLIAGFEMSYPMPHIVEYARAQTQLFEAAYNRPIRHQLETQPAPKLTPNIARFLLFKAKTDRRVQEKIEPVPANLTREQARDLAADIIAVAQFYSLPLDFFLGIGAMENNFLDVRGDLEHTMWKRRAEPGDEILKRRRGRVLVRNYSIGVWQITRETLRYAHGLYLRDKRDYSKLPERLRPPQQLDLDKIDSHVLTAYAGLLFRDLLDRFGGNVEQAVGAYNGGTRNPNSQYAGAVETIAEYARKVLEQAAFINGRAIAETKLVVRAAHQRNAVGR